MTSFRDFVVLNSFIPYQKKADLCAGTKADVSVKVTELCTPCFKANHFEKAASCGRVGS